MKRRASRSREHEAAGPSKITKLDHGAPMEAITDTGSALQYLLSLFPTGAFHTSPLLPPIVLRHQLYSLLCDRTAVDRDIAALRESRNLRMFKLGLSEQDYALMEEGAYRSYLQSYLQDTKSLCHKLVQDVLPACGEVSITKEQLTGELGVREDQVSTLVRHGVLLLRDVGKAGNSWWLGVPGISPFIKSLTKGRSMVQQILRRSKYNEVLERELETRKLNVSKLSMEYHIHDLTGSDLVERVPTTSGPLLKLIK